MPELVGIGRAVYECWPRRKAGSLLFYPGSMLEPGHYRVLLSAFHESGFAVIGIHLPGHGKKHCEKGFTFESLLAAGLEAEALLRSRGNNQIAISGHSQGGILALAHAAASPGLAAAFPIGSAYPDMDKAIQLTRFAPLARYRNGLLLALHKLAKFAPGLPVPLPVYLRLRKLIAGRKRHVCMGSGRGRLAYPLRFLVSLFESAIPRKVLCPLLLFSAKNDALFTPDLIESVFREVDAQDKELCWLSDGGHMAPLNPQLANYIARTAAEKCASLGFPLEPGE